MNITAYKRLHFGDWLITVACYLNCLYKVMAYNASSDTTIKIDKTFVIETDAFDAIITKLKELTIGVVVK